MIPELNPKTARRLEGLINHTDYKPTVAEIGLGDLGRGIFWRVINSPYVGKVVGQSNYLNGDFRELEKDLEGRTTKAKFVRYREQVFEHDPAITIVATGRHPKIGAPKSRAEYLESSLQAADTFVAPLRNSNSLVICASNTPEGVAQYIYEHGHSNVVGFSADNIRLRDYVAEEVKQKLIDIYGADRSINPDGQVHIFNIGSHENPLFAMQMAWLGNRVQNKSPWSSESIARGIKLTDICKSFGSEQYEIHLRDMFRKVAPCALTHAQERGKEIHLGTINAFSRLVDEILSGQKYLSDSVACHFTREELAEIAEGFERTVIDNLPEKGAYLFCPAKYDVKTNQITKNPDVNLAKLSETTRYRLIHEAFRQDESLRQHKAKHNIRLALAGKPIPSDYQLKHLQTDYQNKYVGVAA